jgi:hypothetical protein
MWDRRAQTLNTPLFGCLEKLTDQGFEELLDSVLATGAGSLTTLVIDRQTARYRMLADFMLPLHGPTAPVTGMTLGGGST